MNTTQKVIRVAQTLARVMTRTKDIHVTISGKKAYRVPGRINIPAGDFTDPSVVTMTYGYIDHELGHEEETNHNDFEAVAIISPTHKHFINMVEDVRMEACVGNKFSGAKGNLRKLAQLAIDRKLFARPEANLKPIKLVQMLVLYRGRYRVIGQQCLSAYAKEAEHHIRNLLGEEPTDNICQLVDSIESAKSTYDAGVIALAIMDEIKELDKDNNEDSNDENSSENSNEPPKEADESEDDDSDSSDDSESPDEEQTDEDDESEANEDDADSDKDEGADSDSGDDSDAEDKASEDDSNSQSENDSTQKLKAVAQDILNASEKDGLEDIHELIAKELGREADESEGSLDEIDGAMPSSLNQVKEAILTNAFNESKAKAMGKRIFQKISRVLIDEDATLQIHRTVGKRITTRRLATVSAGNNRIFNRQQTQSNTKAAITFLVDASGSMDGADMIKANEIAFALCHGLNQSNIASEVMYFSIAHSVMDYSDRVHIAKSFDMKHIDAKQFKVRALGGTPTGEAMLNAIPRLFVRPEDKKLMFVITDGQSNDARSVTWSRQFAEKLGIKVIPIGLNAINIDGFRKEEFSSISSIDELPKAINHAIQAKLFA